MPIFRSNLLTRLGPIKKFKPRSSHWRHWLKLSLGDTIFLRASVSPIVLRPSCKNRLQPPNGQSSRITPSRGWLLLRREPSLKRYLFLAIATRDSSWRSFVGGHQIAWPVCSAFLLP